MTNEEFQRLVLEKLGSLENTFEERFDNIEERLTNLEEGQKEIKKDIKSIVEQTVDLSEFRYEINEKVDKLAEEFNTMEIVTSKNWNDIAKLKAAR